MSNNFQVPKTIIGLWQIADMERGGQKLDPAVAAKSMMQYYENGFTCFDMADHYGSSEEIAGYCKKHFAPADIQFSLSGFLAQESLLKNSRRGSSKSFDKIGL